MVIWPGFPSHGDTVASTTATAYATARAPGLRAKIDQRAGWYKNVVQRRGKRCYRHQRVRILGFAGSGSDADLLNESGVTTLIRRDGFRFWGKSYPL